MGGVGSACIEVLPRGLGWGDEGGAGSYEEGAKGNVRRGHDMIASGEDMT